jgi:hypothetical protein
MRGEASEQLRMMRVVSSSAVLSRSALGEGGCTLLFAVEPGYDEIVNSLEHRKAGIEIVSLQRTEAAVYVTVYVPAGKLQILERKLLAYADAAADTPSGRPAHDRLMSIISEIRLAVLADLWTDDAVPLPAPGSAARFEVWTRSAASIESFLEGATAVGVSVSETFLEFPDRRVFLVTGTLEQLATSVQVLDENAEVRHAKELPIFYTELRGPEAREWSEDLRRRTESAVSPAAICLLDTAVRWRHEISAATVT